jgi:hypothetical protein
MLYNAIMDQLVGSQLDQFPMQDQRFPSQEQRSQLPVAQQYQNRPMVDLMGNPLDTQQQNLVDPFQEIRTRIQGQQQQPQQEQDFEKAFLLCQSNENADALVYSMKPDFFIQGQRQGQQGQSQASQTQRPSQGQQPSQSSQSQKPQEQQGQTQGRLGQMGQSQQ